MYKLKLQCNELNRWNQTIDQPITGHIYNKLRSLSLVVCKPTKNKNIYLNFNVLVLSVAPS